MKGGKREMKEEGRDNDNKKAGYEPAINPFPFLTHDKSLQRIASA